MHLQVTQCVLHFLEGLHCHLSVPLAPDFYFTVMHIFFWRKRANEVNNCFSPPGLMKRVKSLPGNTAVLVIPWLAFCP